MSLFVDRVRARLRFSSHLSLPFRISIKESRREVRGAKIISDYLLGKSSLIHKNVQR